MVKRHHPSIVDLLADDSPGSDFAFEPERLLLIARTPDLEPAVVASAIDENGHRPL
ncbi:uncharacterized protein RMCFA_6593 [Mycolicibacterium fortuitum subsp. acetamidolyticum]|uniref:Uncharacterized protein n=1 Tax=Mycolicibacterium fortuitum subsp. acetamidolyticum TaxID=144550 RepID=A0A100WXW8_MYCFO|nr:hypothetical protein [Mycolicibacterium fortuitum]MCV7141767.1 hypothetical protein [Mycolicibacterium fortuitum]GAT06482.1 uncharacterized protein RMCFA_6593 [Mycolicibacterium fortuitum subsp. acetamidolyticum]